MILDRKKLLRYTITALIAGALVMVAVRKDISLLGASDACAIIGLCFIILALFRTAKYLRFYDLPMYSGKRFIELWKHKNKNSKDSKTEAYHEYLNRVEHDKNYLEAYLIGGILVMISILIAILL